MHITTQYLFDSAKKLGYEPQVISEDYNYFTFVKNGKLLHCAGFSIGVNLGIGSKITKDKLFTSSLLQYYGFSVPYSSFIGEIGQTGQKATAAKFDSDTYIVKPAQGSLGNSIKKFTEWDSAEEYARLLEIEKKQPAVIQTFVVGKEYRVVVLDGRIFALEERGVTMLKGDGSSTIAQLLVAEWDKKIDTVYRYPLERVMGEVEKYLSTKEFSLTTILRKDMIFPLSVAPNLYQGGYLHQVNIDSVSSEAISLFENIARVLPLRYFGVDIVFQNGIEGYKEEDSYWILEINSAPNPIVHKFFEPNFGERLLSAI